MNTTSFYKKIFCLIFCMFHTHHLSSGVVILVHGTFSLHAKWCSPGGSFYEELEKQARLRGHKVVPFLWSGALGYKAKLLGAHALTKLALSYAEDETLIFVGHSHGGNLIALLSQLLEQAYMHMTDNFNEQKTVSTTRTTKKKKEKKKKKLSSKISLLHNAITNLATTLFLTRRSLGKRYPIDAVYLLGTPISESYYAPSMDVIGSLYNLYSRGDFIQEVFGLYDRKYRVKHDRLCNLRVLFGSSKKDKKPYSPRHTHLHRKRIATHLFTIPEVVAQTEDMKLHDGTLLFSKQEPPLFTRAYRQLK